MKIPEIKRKLFCWLWLLALTAACRPTIAPPPAITPTPPPQTLRLGLTSSAGALADMVAGPYARQTDRAVLQFVPANNATLFDDLVQNQLHAILVHHIPQDREVWFNPVALDGLVIVVHPHNPVRDLSRGEVQAIFNGRISNWSALGGPDQPIILISREQGSGSRIILQRRIMAEQRISINALIQPDDGALLDAVAAEPQAIGYSMMASATATDLNLLSIDGIPPTTAETASQTYPLTVPLYFVALAEPEGELRAFLAWLQSGNGQMVLGEKYGRVR